MVGSIAFAIGTVLKEPGPFTLARVTAEVAVPEDGAPAEVRLYYVNGLQVYGQLVTNTVGDNLIHIQSPPARLGECRFTVQAYPSGLQLPGDFSQDGRLTIDDPIHFLWHLFLGMPAQPPCDGDVSAGANRLLLDANGDGEANLNDAISQLTYLFLGGPPHVLGTACRTIDGCPALETLCR